MAIQTVFERTEIKYIMTLQQRKQLLERIGRYIKPDEYGESTVCSLYLDTPDYRLIRHSLEKPVYKEKLRLRSYSTPKAGSSVFLELKKKYSGVVYKRRQTLEYTEATAYVNSGKSPNDSQIMREIGRTLQFYGNVAPRVFIAYDRTAFYSKTDHELRITFDRNVRFRTDHLDLGKGTFGERILPAEQCIMEIKALYTMPLWLTAVLRDLKLYPGSFSKYGTAYQRIEQQSRQSDHQYKGGLNCA